MGVIAGYLLPHPPIMVKEVGGGETKKIFATIEAANEVARKVGDLAPDTVVIISPHGPILQDALYLYDYPLKGDLAAFRAPEVRQSYDADETLMKEILRLAREEDIPVMSTSQVPMHQFGLKKELDHGVTVPMYFINKFTSGFKLLPLSYGFLPYQDLYSFGVVLSQAAKALAKKVVVIASGDLSHRLTLDAPAGYDPQGKVFDRTLMDILGRFDLPALYSLDQGLIDAAGECGLRSIWIMAGALDKAEVEPQVLSYEGPFGVGYGVAEFPVVGERTSRSEQVLGKNQGYGFGLKDEEGPYVGLARMALETYVRTGEIPPLPEGLPREMLDRAAGVFVTLKKHGRLRGCIGTFMPNRDNIAQEILHNAIAAGTQDNRFDSVKVGELKDIVYSVDVLSAPEPLDSTEELDPNRYGVIVKKGYRTGLLLPNLDGVDTIEEQLEIALRKAGIWPEKGYKIERFEVVRHL